MRTFKKALYCIHVAALGEGVVKFQSWLRVCNTIIMIIMLMIIIIHFFHPLLQTHLT